MLFLTSKHHWGRQKDLDSVTWCEQLLEEEHVATVAGSAFGAEGHVRMSFAASEEKLIVGLDRIARFIGSMQ